jgi:hypothetical protein
MTDKPVYVERRPGDCAILRANSERTSDVLPTRKHDRKAAAIEAECEALERRSKAEDARWGRRKERRGGRFAPGARLEGAPLAGALIHHYRLKSSTRSSSAAACGCALGLEACAQPCHTEPFLVPGL